MKYENRDKLIVKAKKLRGEGFSWQKIADKLGVGKGETIQRWFDPTVCAKINARNNKYHNEHRNECNARARNRYKDHKAEYIARAKQWGKEHPELKCKIQARYRETHREELRKRSEEYDDAHRVERKHYYEKHRLEIGEKQKEYQKIHRDEIRVQKREYYKAHKAEHYRQEKKWCEENPERVREIKTRYRETHREELLAREYLRKGRIKEYEEITQPEYDAIFERQKGLCVYCGKTMLTTGDSGCPDYKTLEHIYPLDKGGPHIIDNLAFVCRSCNSSKGVKTVANWRPELLAKIGNGV